MESLRTWSTDCWGHPRS